MDFQNSLSFDLKSLSNSNKNVDSIPFINIYNGPDLSYETFLVEHMYKNVPCIIRNITKDWSGCLLWLKNAKPNFDYLINKYGDTLVPVANCGDRYYNSQKKEEQTLKQYLNYWKLYISNNYSSELPCYYLKDWHFARDFPEDHIYRVPTFFGSDWLNEYFIAKEEINDDYRFVYMGPKGSWTPFHVDVFSSFSWSVNLSGKKRWVLFPPGAEKYLTDKHGNLVYDIECSTLEDSTLFIDYSKSVPQYEVIQNPGEAIFVPSGWHHQVWNLEDTISVNHNWVNGLNIDKMWSSLQHNLAAVKSEISDCRDMEGWHQHCQLMLNATYGINYKQFCQFLLHIVRVRIQHLQENRHLKLFCDLLLEQNHMKLDLYLSKNILEQITSDLDFKSLNHTTEESQVKSVIEEINTIMDRK